MLGYGASRSGRSEIHPVQKVESDDRVTGRVDTGVEGVGGYMLGWGGGGEVDNSVRALYQGGSRSGRIEAYSIQTDGTNSGGRVKERVDIGVER